jgi:uncharacterized protein YdeI (YjbR/CyaY-like superfamily)
MNPKDPRVDAFFRHVLQWRNELSALRDILLNTDLVESYKWGQPCYTYDGKNVIILAGFSTSFAVSYLKGALLQDTDNVLESPGPNSRSARFIRFIEMSQIAPLEKTIRSYVAEAITLEISGAKIQKPSAEDLVLPEELLDAFRRIVKLEQAFYALTPGRQRAYVMHFSSAKQSATRVARIEKYGPKIIEGKGLQD